MEEKCTCNAHGLLQSPADALLAGMQSKYRRSAKEWYYMKEAGVTLEMGLYALIGAMYD